MNNFDLIKMACVNLYNRKLRTFLTMLSVIIGTTAIVLIFALGIGLKENIVCQIEKTGSLKEISIQPGATDADWGVLTTTDVNKIKKIQHVTSVVPIRRLFVTIMTNKYINSVDLIGIEDAYIENFSYKLAEGRLLKKGERASIVVGNNIIEQMQEIKKSNSVNQITPPPVQIDITKDGFFLVNDQSGNPTNPDEEKKIKKMPIKVVGVGTADETELIFKAVINLSEWYRIKSILNIKTPNQSTEINDKNIVDEMIVTVTDKKHVEVVQKKLKKLGFTTFSQIELINQATQIVTFLQLILGSIAAISLFISGIGITNTMMMSVVERKKEIGVMKVIGASIKDIRKLFLFEANMIGFCGGAIGIVCCYVLSLGINQFSGVILKALNNGYLSDTLEQIIIIPWWLVIGTVAFTAMLGVAAGYFPARRAMRLSALEAINS